MKLLKMQVLVCLAYYLGVTVFVSDCQISEGSPSPCVINPDADKANEDIRNFGSIQSGQPGSLKVVPEVIKIRPVPINKGIEVR